MTHIIASALILIILAACRPDSPPYALSDFKALNTLHTELEEPVPGEWLYNQKESGQSFKEYFNSNPVHPTRTKSTIYFHLVGNFDSLDLYALEMLRSYTGAFFGLKVVMKAPIWDSLIPAASRRIHEGHEQFHTEYFLHHFLRDNFPDSALLNVAITRKDLYPQASWNFVFGQASLTEGVAVSSIYRYKSQGSDALRPQQYLERIIKTITHEMLHALSLKHCTDYKCLMNGSNSLNEADKKPTSLCGECLAKLMCFSTIDMENRYDELIQFWQENESPEKARFYQKSKELFFD